MNERINDFGPRAEDGAINVYQGDSADEFPVLKAFQQYIDAEQAKARKRLILICVFFCFILTIVIGVFVALLLFSSSRSQALNDRLVEYVMKDREHDRERHAVVVPPRDDSAIQALTRRLEDISRNLEDNRKAATAVTVTDETATKKASVESLEIERLKALLSVEKEKNAAEREKARQAELEAYRRKHYPELYEQKSVVKPADRSRKIEDDAEAADREIESIIKDMKAIDYFDEEVPAKAEKPVKKAPGKENGATPFGNDAVEARSMKVSTGSWEFPQDAD